MTRNPFNFIILLSLFFLCSIAPVRMMAQVGKAESILSQMTLEEKIAQLLIVRVSSTGTPAENEKMLEEIRTYQPGGVCFFKGSPIREALLTNQMQSLSKVPMFISIDGEWGISMRLDSCVEFPRQMTLGALSTFNDSLIYKMGVEVANQCKAVGINLNFAPCVDINNNSKNPVINSRSFGENRYKVVQKASLYLNGMQDGGIAGCLKHFPGHGDTESDSHLGLPTISKSRSELEEMELFPYRQMIGDNADMIMVAHLNIPALDTTPECPSSLSYPIITKLLKQEYGFSGIIITDGMEMKGVRQQDRFDGDAEIRALLAGVDILLLPGKTETIVHAIKQAVDSGKIPVELIDDRCLRILQYKEKKGILDYTPVDIAKIPDLINTPSQKQISEEIERKAITMLTNHQNFLPMAIVPNDTIQADSIVFLCIGREEYQKEYQKIASRYGLVYIHQSKFVPEKNEETFIQKFMDTLRPYRRVIIAYGGSNQLAAQHYGVEKKSLALLNRVAKEKEAVLLHLGNPYVLDDFDSTTDYKAVLVTYQSTPNSVKSALEVCFGERECEGTLPVSTKEFPGNAGILARGDMANFSALPDSITNILDQMLANGIQSHLFPGCEVVVLKDGKTLYNKAFGYLTYDRQTEVSQKTLYDVASVTKAAATTLAVMKLYEEHKIKLSDHIGEYLPYLQGTNKSHITLYELLTHTSGLPAFIPFYTKIQGNENYLLNHSSQKFMIPVAENLYLRNDYLDTMRNLIAHCNLGHHQYVYSDLNFLLLKEMVEKITGIPMDVFLSLKVYKPMGLTNTCFTPLSHGFDKSEIAPTENDKTFRKQVVHGYVHDQTAALFNGNGGNAGLFSNAGDIAAIFQMLLDGGYYNGTRIFNESTVKLFTSTYETHGCKVRGLGFHTPKHPGSSDIVPQAASNRIFGHQGFTGTVVWCDPENRMVYVFLSNRVHPDAYPNRLSKSRLRLTLHEKFYEAIP